MRKLTISLTLYFIWVIPVFASFTETGGSMALKYLERAGILYERSEYDSLPYYYQSSMIIFDSLDMHVRVVECMFGMVDFYRMLNRQGDASSLLNSAEALIDSNIGRNSESWADALYIRAKLYAGENRQKESIQLLNDCLDLQNRLGLEPEKMARVHYVLGVAYYTMGDLGHAEINYREAYETYMEISSEPTVEKGILLFNIGLIYSQWERQQEWVEYTLRGIENNILLFGPDFPDLADYYNSLASYYITEGMLDSAWNNLYRAESILVNAFGNRHYNLSRIYINKARLYKYEGNYQESLEYFLHALQIIEIQEVPIRSLANIAYINISNLYASLGDFKSSYTYASRLLDSEGFVHPNLMARYYRMLADVQTHLGNFVEAEELMMKVFSNREMHSYEGQVEPENDHLVYGTLMDSLNQPVAAEGQYQEALKIARLKYGEYHYRTSGILKTIGDHFYAHKSYPNALDYYQKAIRSIVPEYNKSEIAENPELRQVTNLLFYLRILKKKAEVLEILASISPMEEENYIRAAFSAYNFSVQAIELLRSSYLNDESKLYLSENERSTHEKCIQAAYRCFELSSDPEFIESAFQTAEKGKYATLQSVLRREEALNLSAIPDSLRIIETELKNQLSVFQELLLESQDDILPDEVAIQQYRSGVFQVKDQIAALHRSLELDYPDYYNLLYNYEVIAPDIIARSLGKSEKVLEYFKAGNQLYIFEISRKEFRCNRLILDGGFRSDLDIVERYISNSSIRDTIQDDHLAFIASATRLYKWLIPVSGNFRDLIIIPEGTLSYFPYDILITDTVEEFSGLFSEVPFLIRSHSIRYGYSATLLFNQQNRAPGNLNKFIAFAPGYMKLEKEMADVDPLREIKMDRSSLEALPGSIDEVLEIGNLLGGSTFTGISASEKRFKSLAGESHIIHLATHAFLDDQDPLKSKLVFSDDNDEAEDGMLNVYELYNLDLKARLVVLSACNTGLGIMKGGEGIMSLARAFYYAGVPNIVMTLWTVSDRQSSELMLGFYKYLARGRRAETSLRKAKLDFLENALPAYQHPRYWAGYILVGNPENLFLPIIKRKIIPLALVILLILAGILLISALRGNLPYSCNIHRNG